MFEVVKPIDTSKNRKNVKNETFFSNKNFSLKISLFEFFSLHEY